MDKLRNEKGAFACKHGGRHEPLYRVWCGMKERCNNPHNKRYSCYGAKGIRVCEEWSESYASFREWAHSTGYSKGLTIDRIDNLKGYSPENCRWATTAEQNRNYSRNHLLTYDGKTMCIADWAKELGIKQATIQFRIKAGKPINEILQKEDGRTLRWKTTSLSYTASM